MTLVPELVNVCLVVKGFPPEICPAEVAARVSFATATSVVAIAATSPAGAEGGWLLRLRCHDDQKNCLLKNRTLAIQDGNRWLQVKLDYPHLSLTSEKLNWIVLTKEERMDSVASEDIFGAGANAEAGKTCKTHGPTATGQMSSPPGIHGQQGLPHYMTPGREYHHMMHQPMEQGFSRHPIPSPYFQVGDVSNQESVPDSCTSNPTLSTLGVDCRSDASSSVPDIHAPHQPQEGFYSPMGQGQGRMPLGVLHTQQFLQSGPYVGVGTHDKNMAYPAQFPPSQGTPEFLLQGMANLKFNPAFQHQGQYYHQPEHFREPSMGYQNKGNQPGQDDRPEQDKVYLKVTELPTAITEAELKEFFQSRQESGGGPVTNITFSAETKSAAIVFEDVEDIERVIRRAPLLLKDKKICVEKACRDQQEPEIKTVEIRGLETEGESEMCTYYFENPARGGDIENSQWNDAEKIFLITFVDAAVAKAVASKGHTLAGKVLEVSLYTPPAYDEDLPQCTILVRGFDASRTDLYEMYFSNPRRGGDNIVEFCISEDENAMYITFESPEVAERMAGKTHSVGGRQLDVVLAPVERPSPPSTVKVTGCNLDNPDMYRYYFENPNRGGGDISDFVVDEKEKAIVIIFCDPEVAERLVSMEHKVKNQTLNVSMYTPEKSPPKRQPSQEGKRQEEEEEPALKTVVVKVGQQPLETRDTYTLYFESPRHGGGEVDDVDVDEEKKLIYVTFQDAAVASRVASREHRYQGHRLDVSLYKPRPVCPNKLLFKNVADSTTHDCLCMYLERVTNLEPQEVLYGDEVGTVLVTFDKEPDIARTMQMCQKRKLEGRKLTVSKVPISNCLLVENLSPVTTESTLEFYFENKRSKGGPVERVDLIPGEGRGFIYFEDHSVLEGVLSKSHTLDNSQLVVKRYMECLGLSGGSKDPTAFNMPKPVTMDTIDCYKVAYLRQSKKAQAAFLQQLSQNHARGKFTGDSLVLECSLTPAVDKARILARTWAVDIQQTVENFISQLVILRRDVMQQIWGEVDKAVQGAGLSSADEVVLFTLSEETAFVVVGEKSMVQDLFEKLNTTIKAVEDAFERKKQEVTETNSKLKNYQLRLLLAMGFQAEAERRHEGLKVEIQLKKNSIIFHGLLKDVREEQIEMYNVIQPIQSDRMTKLSHRQKRLLESKEVRPYIVQKFKQSNIVAVWEMDVQSQITVFAFSDKSLVEAIHVINQCVPEHVCQLSLESAELLYGTPWMNLVKRLTDNRPGVLMITPDYDNQKVYITCTDNIMHGMVEEIEIFLEENTIYCQVVRFSPSRQLFVQQEWHQRLISLQNSLQAHRVQIIMKEAGTEFYIKGTKKGLKELQAKLEELNSQIICHEEKLKDVAKVRCLSSSNTDRDLKVLGQANHCVVSLKPETDRLEVVHTGSTAATMQDTRTMQTTANVQLPSGVTIAAVQGDITQLPADVIVNAANNKMHHSGGLAADIVDKGGQIIQDESYKALKAKGHALKEGDILITGGGNLPCKAIVHAIGPVYRGGYSSEDDCLHATIMNCLVMAADLGHSSIAFPAISTGIFRYPAKEATRIIAEAVKAYLDSHKKCKIKSVYMCHLTADIVQLFADAIHRVFPMAHSTPSVMASPTPLPAAGTITKGAASVPKNLTGQRVIGVTIVEGEIAKQSADVLVNSTSNGLDLQNGAISGSILRMAGHGLQEECKRKYPKGIATGNIARTAGYGLDCKEVFHLALCNWLNPNAQQVLGGCVIKCLTEASKQHYRSIAFPVLGVGNLGYPAEIVAETMLRAIDEFQQKTPSTSLRSASIVVYQAADKKNLQVFQEAQKMTGGGLTFPQPQASSKPTGMRQKRRFSTQAENQPKPSAQKPVMSGTSAVFEIGKLKLVIKQGDITEEAADAIVNSSNAKLDLNLGNVASALKAKCGDKLVRECETKVADIKDRGITHTKAYNMKSRIILHINSAKFSSDWGNGIKKCLEEAEALAVQTLAMPALGTGAYGQSPYQSATALFHSLVRVISAGLRHLQEVRVVLFDIKMIPPFVTAVEELGNQHAKSNTGGLFNWFKSAAPSVKQTYVATELTEATLYIYASSRTDIPKILQAFDDLVMERFVEKEVIDDVLLTLNPGEIDQIDQLRTEHKVEISVQQARGRVLVQGLQHDVFEAMQKISQILRQVERHRQELQAASMLANMIQWSFLDFDGTTNTAKPVKYDQRENQIIEMAYQNKRKNVEFSDADGNVYVIDFDSMMEYPKLNPSDTADVLRQDKIKETASGVVPDNWTPHSTSEHVKVVSLPSSDKEYKTVEANFRATLGNRNLTITAIDRIQNRTLYQQYASKRAHLMKQNQGIENEKILWHGTAHQAIENINNYGFNRSYCGKNAVAYGKGVYFAVNSNYSTHPTYSQPDSSGKRYIYQCKVLVGHAVNGNNQMRVLPAREGPILYDSATNNVNNSNMYVIFNDTQAYPEYLITFTGQ